MEALVNYLGERLRERAQVEATTGEYLRLLSAMRADGIRGAVSIKPTQFGLLIDKSYALSQIFPVLEAAKGEDRVLWLDMEGADTTDDTLWICERLLERYDKVGICLQANLKRTPKDVEWLARTGARIRLVKGAYKEPPDIAFVSRAEIDRAFLAGLEILFAKARDLRWRPTTAGSSSGPWNWWRSARCHSTSTCSRASGRRFTPNSSRKGIESRSTFRMGRNGCPTSVVSGGIVRGMY